MNTWRAQARAHDRNDGKKAFDKTMSVLLLANYKTDLLKMEDAAKGGSDEDVDTRFHPRLFNFLQIFDMTSACVENSRVAARVAKLETALKKVNAHLEKLDEADAHNLQQLQKTEETIEAKIQTQLNDQAKWNESSEKRFIDTARLVKENIERMVSQANQIKRIAKGQDSNDDKILKMVTKVETLKSDMS